MELSFHTSNKDYAGNFSVSRTINYKIGSQIWNVNPLSIQFIIFSVIPRLRDQRPKWEWRDLGGRRLWWSQGNSWSNSFARGQDLLHPRFAGGESPQRSCNGWGSKWNTGRFIKTVFLWGHDIKRSPLLAFWKLSKIKSMFCHNQKT